MTTTRFPNARSDGVDSQIQWVERRSRGYRARKRLFNAIYFPSPIRIPIWIASIDLHESPKQRPLERRATPRGLRRLRGDLRGIDCGLPGCAAARRLAQT